MTGQKQIYLGWRWGSEWDTASDLNHVKWCAEQGTPEGDKYALETYGEVLTRMLLTCVPAGWATNVLQPHGDEGYPEDDWGNAYPAYFTPMPLGVGQPHGPLKHEIDTLVEAETTQGCWLEKY